MSTAEILSFVSVISYVLAGVCVVIAVVLWFAFKIPAVIGDLSGRTAKKSIARMRSGTAQSAARSRKTYTTANIKQGASVQPLVKKEVTVTGDEVAAEPKKQADSGMVETDLLVENHAETMPTEETDLLTLARTAVKCPEAAGETELLEGSVQRPVQRMGGVSLTLLEEVILIHTKEVIE